MFVYTVQFMSDLLRCLKTAEHELTRCHEGLTKDNHGARTMALQWHFYFEFSAWRPLDCRLRDLAGGRDLADWRPAFRTARLPSQSLGIWGSPLHLLAWTALQYGVVVVIRSAFSCCVTVDKAHFLTTIHRKSFNLKIRQ